MKPVSLMISFEDLFPEGSRRAERIKRWARWKALAASEPEQVEAWETDFECFECSEYCSKKDWCSFGNLPPSVNPYLSFRHGMPGLACMGLRPPQERQGELFAKEEGD